MTPPTDTAALLRLEAVSMAAWPGLQTIMDGPWAVRFGCGYTSRANSIAIFEPADDAQARLVRCSNLLAAQGLPVIVRVGSLVEDEIGPLLDKLGFAPWHLSVATLWRALAPRPLDPRVEITLSEASEDWQAAKDLFNGESGDFAAARRRLMSAIACPLAFGAVRGNDGDIQALAYCAIHDGCASLNMVATDPMHRGKGLAEVVCEGLLAWAASQGARDACLQVQRQNISALKLYARMGFSAPLYTYDYRTREITP